MLSLATNTVRTHYFVILAICLLGLLFWTPLGDPDFWWHLRVGNDILGGQGIPRIDTYTWTVLGRQFVDFYWLYDVGMAFLFKTTGPIGLSFIFSLIITATLLIRIRTANQPFTFRSLATLILFSWAMMTTTGIRPLMLSWLFFVLFLTIVDHIRSLNYWKVCGLSLGLFVLWFNLHDGFVFFLLYLGLLIIVNAFFWLCQAQLNYSSSVPWLVSHRY